MGRRGMVSLPLPPGSRSKRVLDWESSGVSGGGGANSNNHNKGGSKQQQQNKQQQQTAKVAKTNVGGGLWSAASGMLSAVSGLIGGGGGGGGGPAGAHDPIDLSNLDSIDKILHNPLKQIYGNSALGGGGAGEPSSAVDIMHKRARDTQLLQLATNNALGTGRNVDDSTGGANQCGRRLMKYMSEKAGSVRDTENVLRKLDKVNNARVNPRLSNKSQRYITALQKLFMHYSSVRNNLSQMERLNFKMQLSHMLRTGSMFSDLFQDDKFVLAKFAMDVLQ